MKLKIKGFKDTWGFVETYKYSNSGESRTLRFVAGFDVDTGTLCAPQTFFSQEFMKLTAENVVKYCKSKKPLHTVLVGKIIPISVLVRLRGGHVTATIQPLKVSITVPETEVMFGSHSTRIEEALYDQLSTFIRQGNISREKYYEERVKWAKTT